MRRTLMMIGVGCTVLGGCAMGSRVDTGDLYADLGRGDLRVAARTMQEALETRPDGEALAWTGGRSGWSGSFRPVRTFVTSGGYFCRTYEETLNDGRKEERFQHDACRNEKGSWIWL